MLAVKTLLNKFHVKFVIMIVLWSRERGFTEFAWRKCWEVDAIPMTVALGSGIVMRESGLCVLRHDRSVPKVEGWRDGEFVVKRESTREV